MRLPKALKISAIVLVFYALIAGLLVDVPHLDILNETIRNLFFHVTSWFAMVFLFIAALVHSVKFLSTGNPANDLWAKTLVEAGLVFGTAGMLTGMLWAKYTWGAYWVPDPKLNGAAIAMLAYLAYVVLRNSLSDPITRGKMSAVYNIFAFVMMLVFVFVLPRMTSSLHPGNGGNPAFSNYDLDSTMRWVFYPAILGWILLGLWMSELRYRIEKRKQHVEELEMDAAGSLDGGI